MKKHLIIDGNSIVNRAFYGVSQNLATQDGQPTGAIYGFLTILNKLVREQAPQALSITFDEKAPTFRHLAYADYKGKRKKMPEELASQLPLLKEVLAALNIPCFSQEGWEADDLMGTMAHQGEEAGWLSVLVTGDKDSLQLITDQTHVNLVVTKMGQTQSKVITPQIFQEDYGFPAIHIIDLKSLMGDASDNIPGVKGMGEKTVLPLIQTHHSIDVIFQKLNSDPEETLGLKGKMLERLREGEEEARMSYDLATIRKNAPLTVNPQDCLCQDPNQEALTPLLLKLELFKLLESYGISAPPPQEETFVLSCQSLQPTTLEESRSLLASWTDLPRLFVLPLPHLAGVAVHHSSTCALFLESQFPDYGTFLQELFTAPLSLVVHGSRNLIFDLLQEGITPTNITFDTEIAAYLLSPDSGSYQLEALAKRYCRFTPQPSSHYDSEEAFAPLGDLALALGTWMSHCALLELLYDKFSPKLEELGMTDLYHKVELPLAPILAGIQQEGVFVDRSALTLYGEELASRLKILEEEIYEEAGEPFNINSPKQLGFILFEKLELPPIKKTKTGYSTNADVLEKLRENHPDRKIIPQILEQRQLSKLQSTYAQGLLKVLSPQGKIHSKLQNTVTATGRLSSTEPNLQNIPIRTPLGAKLRHMFVAQPGMVLLDADYSQIELRLLAHMAQDQAMISAFLSGEDIHAQTAAQVFRVQPEEVTSEMRRAAKAVNFGIVYGISPFSLSQDIGVTVPEAKSYIDRYFTTYEGIKVYMDQVVEQAKTDGFVTTLLGRKRWIPELTSSNFHTRSFGQRIALNMPIQGTAADVIKLAMIAVDQGLKEGNFQGKLILQVHDELILQCPQEEAEALARLVQEKMEGVMDLSVPLLAETHQGKSWGDAH